MDRITDKLEETIKSSIDRLDTLDKMSPEYGQLVTIIAKLNEQRLKEAELDAAAISRAEDRAMEDEKMAHETALKEEETRQTKLKGYFDLGKSVVSLVGTVGATLLILTFEQIEPVVSKALTFIPKPKI